jgi:hypothetical protein
MKSKEEIEQLAERYADGYSTEEAHASYIAFQDGYTQCQEDMELSDWDVTLTDGLEEVEWDNKQAQSPKDKAKDLFDKYADEFNFDDTYRGYREQSKQCALVVVDEIIKECYNWNGSDNVQWETNRFDYWNEVKQEIDKL